MVSRARHKYCAIVFAPLPRATCSGRIVVRDVVEIKAIDEGFFSE